MASGTVQIITDSTCALPDDLPQALRAHVRMVRTSVQVGSESFAEGSFALDDFYRRLERTGEIPRSSQPAPEEFAAAFGAAAPHGPVLAILLSAALSGTFASGQVVAGQVEGDIALFDSQFFSSALGYMVAEAAEMALAGATRGQIVERLTWRRARTALFIAVDTLAFLRRSGRVNMVQAGLATMFDLKPLLAVRGGRLEAVARVRSRARSLERLLALTEEAARGLGAPLWGSAMHGHAAPTAAQLLAALGARLPLERAFVSEAPASVALHAGPGVVGLMVTTGQRWQP